MLEIPRTRQHCPKWCQNRQNGVLYFVIKTHCADIFDFLWQPASNVLNQPSLFWKANFFVQLLYKAFLFESVNIVYDIIYFYKNTLVYIIATLVAHIGAIFSLAILSTESNVFPGSSETDERVGVSVYTRVYTTIDFWTRSRTLFEFRDHS